MAFNFAAYTQLQALSCATLFVAVLVVVKKYFTWRWLVLSTPPGPSPLPLVGNFFSIPATKAWKTYAAWSETYKSDLISVRAFGQLCIVINSEKAARDLLSKRAQNYSSRPGLSSLLRLVGWDWVIGVMPYGDHYRTRRRLLGQALRGSVVGDYSPVQTKHTRKLLLQLLKKPKGFYNHVKAFSTGIAMEIAYGYEIKENDPYVEMAEEATLCFTKALIPGAMIENILPILSILPEWFPGGGFNEFTRRGREATEKMRFGPVELVKKNMINGTDVQSVARTLLESGESEETAANVAGDIYAAGIETIVSSITACMSAFALHPEVQRRAQEEIERVVGRERFPTLDDRAALPYIDAICMEIQRWRVVVPLGLLRISEEDDVYEGWHIPKGAQILWNTWAIANNPRSFPEPERFMPERWLDGDHNLINKDFDAPFGYGRRQCVGMHLGKATLFLAISSLLAVMNVRKSKDKNGNEVEISLESSDALVSLPVNFECDIEPRDRKALELLGTLEM